MDTGDMFLYRRFEHPKGWDRQHIRRFLENKFRRHPAVAPIIRNDPPVFTSSHAPFFALYRMGAPTSKYCEPIFS
jgi:hypothetical protein